ncbi:hypothetical protein HJFPF1_07248 [Paramyrothecium foliicola]|nr:hypothetical protein HJFPF1_07248 [Paramyrothecium foliicola]
MRCASTTCLRQQGRFQSTAVSLPPAANNSTSQIASGVAGGVVAGAVLCSVDFPNPSSTSLKQDVNVKTFEANPRNNSTPQNPAQGADHALDYIKEFCYSYVSWVPGGHRYLDTAFKDIEVLKQSHEEEVNHIVKDIYEELQLVSSAGFSFKNVRKTFDVFARLGEQCGELASGVRPSSTTISTT